MNEIVPFNYSTLPAPVAAEIEAVTTRIKDRLIRQVTDIIETGRDLQDVKAKLAYGQFESWLNLSFNMTVRTAQKYMRAAEWMADKSELSSHLTPNTIYLLSAPSTPESVQEAVIDDLEAGKPVNHREVREAVDEAKDEERKEGRTAALIKAKREAFGWVLAREVADILVNKLSEDEVAKVYKALCDSNLTRQGLVEAIHEAWGNDKTLRGPQAFLPPSTAS